MYSKNDVVFDSHKMIERSRTSTDACRETCVSEVSESSTKPQLEVPKTTFLN